MNEPKTVKVDVSTVPVLLFLVFLLLKLTHVLEWSWVWVTAPLWGSVVLAVVAAVIVWRKLGKMAEDN